MPEPTPADAARARLLRLVGDLNAAADALPDALAGHLAALDADLADARREATDLRAQVDRLRAEAERAEMRHTLEMEQAADESQQAADDAERDAVAARDEASRLQTDLAAAHADIARLRAEFAARPRTPPKNAAGARPETAHTRSAPVTPEPSRANSAPDPSELSTAARLSEAFRAWCSAATPVMGKVEFFAGHARTALPGAGVVAVYRDANSQATPVALSARGGASPVEHWLVALDGRHWLLPQPMTAAQFRELRPCFEGVATPAGLTDMAPAEVRVVGDRYEIARPGRVA